ncbi:MAG: 50S ribosomal protein L24 [Anaerolineae bacterium]|nr:50S ribosomal protein L24 [Anaerolineae bacterium]
MRKIRRNDNVVVISGEHRGLQGQVLRIDTGKDKAVVQGVNLVKVHEKRTRQRDGGIIEREAPVHVSNLAVVCPACGESGRLGVTVTAEGKRVRFCKKCNETIE